jgi:DNA polymerase
MDVITVDFETYYDRAYSLSKITTEEYVRHDNYETIGVSVKVNDGKTLWYSGPDSGVRTFLGQFDWEHSTAVAHNAVFDMAILSWRYDVRPKRIMDTLSMARALGHGSVSLKSLAEYYGLGVKGTEVVNALGKRRVDFTPAELAAYGDYCCNDTNLTYELLLTLLAGGFPASELKLIDLTIRMFTEPTLELNPLMLGMHKGVVAQTKAQLLATLGADREAIGKNDFLATELVKAGVVPPTKISPTTGKEAYAFAKTDEEFTNLLEHPSFRVQALVAARLGVKSTLEETRTQRFIDICARGLLPIPLRYYAAHTGRWGGDDKVNLQNLPRGSTLKKAIQAPEGYVLIDSDSSQIEARTLAWLAGQDDLVAAFDAGEDVYRMMAATIYNKALVDVTKLERQTGKATILGAGYGMGAERFQVQLKSFGVETSIEECRRIITVYRETYPQITALWKQAEKAIEAMAGNQSAPLGREGVLTVCGADGVRLPNGLFLRYPRLRREALKGDTKVGYVYDSRRGRAVVANRIYGPKLVENACQALARIIIGEQMLRIARKYRVVMTVHDSVCAIVPTDEEEAAKANIAMFMRLRPAWGMDLPLDCEVKSGPTYG